MTFYPLTVLDVKQETADAVSVSFDVPQEWYDVFNYKPGQYLTLKFNINGEEVRRSYSLCSSPVVEEPLRIGVKRVKGGLVSNYINDHVKPGDVIEVMPPDGRFVADVAADNYKTYYLFAAGSGITPIMSILRTVLYTEERSYVHMIFGNRSQDSIIFKNELDQLQEDYADRLILVHSLSKPTTSWFSSKKEFDYRKGRVDAEAVKWFIDEYPPYAQNAEYYICGPGKMIEHTKQALMGIDVPESRIFIESFGGGESIEVEGVANCALTATLNGQTVAVNVPAGKTILRALIDDNHNPPYSCEGGVCSTCVCTLKSGKVAMKKNMALSEKEVASGLILSCQSIPLTPEVEIRFTN